MKKVLFLFVLIAIAISDLYSQDTIRTNFDSVSPLKHLKDSVSFLGHKKDSVKPSLIQHGTQVLVSSIFGESRKLNNADSIINRLDAMPSFGIYKDNYIVMGTELFHKPTEYNSDAKFQVSIRQRLTNSTLPFKTYFFLTYTQKAFWGIFQESFPFLDLNFNPSLGLGRAIVYNNRLLGSISFQFEHESNGKDGPESRSWNRITFGSTLIFNDNWTLNSRAWIPIIDGENNRDVVHYTGWGQVGMEYSSAKKKYNASCVVVKRGGPNLNANITLNFSIRLFSDDNQYLFLEYYNGYGESLLFYNEYRQRIRLGIVIRPDFLNMY